MRRLIFKKQMPEFPKLNKNRPTEELLEDQETNSELLFHVCVLDSMISSEKATQAMVLWFEIMGRNLHSVIIFILLCGYHFK